MAQHKTNSTKPEPKTKAKGKAVQSNPTKVKVIKACLGFFAILPTFIGSGIACLFAYSSKWFSTKSYKTSLTNIKICLPDYSKSEQEQLALKSLRHTGCLFFEVAKVWKRAKGEAYISKIYGEDKVKACLSQGKGVLITGGHIGNWEVALHYLGSRYPFHCMYRPPRQLEMDEVLSTGRCQNTTTMVKGDSRGVMHLIDRLKKAEVAAVLSDQEPGRRAGVFVPFCGKKALTMTIVQKIQQKSQSELFQIAAIRNSEGKYDIHLEPLIVDLNTDEEQYAEHVNEYIESMIKRFPEQYQWSYKRFKTTESGEPNPYKK